MFSFNKRDLNLLTTPITLEIPLYQRSYAWTLNEQWKPLWEDIKNIYESASLGDGKTTQHFFGTIILQHEARDAGEGQKFLVIDGQQRLTTIQIFIAAFRDVRESLFYSNVDNKSSSFVSSNNYLINHETYNRKAEPKLRPSKRDTELFNMIIKEGILSPLISDILKDENNSVLTKFFTYDELLPGEKSSVTKKISEVFKSNSSLIVAYCYFYWQIKSYFAERKLEEKQVQKFWDLFIGGFEFASIELAKDSDPQVIFECINGRGVPLLAIDLIKNHIFLKTSKTDHDLDQLYEKYWSKFNEDIWSEDTRIGRFKIPFADVFLLHYLTSYNIPNLKVERLFNHYIHWTENDNFPFKHNIEQEMADVVNNSEYYKLLITGSENNDVPFYNFLRRFDHSTPFPLLMLLNRLKIEKEQFSAICQMLESFLIRRFICGMPSQGLNHLFIYLINHISGSKTEPTATELTSVIHNSTNKAWAWISDEDFKQAWIENKLYKRSNSNQVLYILSQINDKMSNLPDPQLRDSTVSYKLNNPSVEHILPQEWEENWELSDNTQENRAKRDAALQTIGNLTIISGKLNTFASNKNWQTKKDSLQRNSQLKINDFERYSQWDENSISERAKDLFDYAQKIWKFWPNLRA
ncbi:MAG: DUF262 domain-containing HNH endonuclease family protein [Candidatus Symbiobacter sp.]|nr:DUF262 domain-containing HNH endonuclease family protein [Candidatus Symbiobacter sp.]